MNFAKLNKPPPPPKKSAWKKISPLIEDLRYLTREDFEYWYDKEIGFRQLCSRTIIFIKQSVREEKKKAYLDLTICILFTTRSYVEG